MNRTAAMQPIKEMVSAGKQAMSRKNPETSEHLNRWKKHMGKAVGSSLGAIVLGGVAVVALKKAFDAAHKHTAWANQDHKLDARLAESLDASDPVAAY